MISSGLERTLSLVSSRAGRRVSLPAVVLWGAATLFVIGGVGPNLLLALLAIAVLLAGTLMLWRPGESAILLFIFVVPWAQTTTAIFHSNWIGIDISEYSPFFGNTYAAVVLSLTGIFAMAVGLRMGAGRQLPHERQGIRELALSQPLIRWFHLYALAWAAGFVASSFAWLVPGLTQPLLAIASMRWAFFYTFAFAYFVRGRGGLLFPLVFLFEFVSAIGHYFSDFKTVFFVTLLAAVASVVRFSPRALAGSATIVAALLAMGIVWTAIKGEYRNFISGGQSQQIVTVDYPSRLAKLAQLTSGLGQDELADGIDQFLRRLSYIDFFGAALNIVPASLPHTDGAILWDAIRRPFMPRLLFENKTAIDDTARTSQYTGGLVQESEGTSISIGYVAEAYIDFGALGMVAELLGIGLLYGAIYRFLLRWRHSRGLFGVALATAALVTVGSLENSFTKVFGGVAVALLAAWTVAAFVAPRLAPWLPASRR